MQTYKQLIWDVAMIGFVVMALLVLNSCAFGATIPISVYFVAGQSNAVGWAKADGLPAHLAHQPDILFRDTRGLMENSIHPDPVKGTFGPELSFARAMSDSTREKIAIVKFAWGGTSL
jgi:hypothetical protein